MEGVIGLLVRRECAARFAHGSRRFAHGLRRACGRAVGVFAVHDGVHGIIYFGVSRKGGERNV